MTRGLMHAPGTLSHLTCIKSPMPLRMPHPMQLLISHHKALFQRRNTGINKKYGHLFASCRQVLTSMKDLIKEEIKMTSIKTKLAGVSFGNCQRNIKLLGNHGINEFDINRESENQHDPNAIWIGFGKYKLGYLPRPIAKKMSALMQAGKNFVALFVSVNRSPFHDQVGITVKITELTN